MKLKQHLTFLSIFCSLGFNALATEEPTSATSRRLETECTEVLESEEKFSNFRQSPFCRNIIDTLGESTGRSFIQFVMTHYPHLKPYFEMFRQNDYVGNPILGNYAHWGYFCPTTLRYVKIAGDLEFLFGSLDGKTIVEIGGGYGGQCRILSTLFAFKEYIIVDLPDVVKLTEKYLQKYGVKNVRFITPDQLPQFLDSDVLISNYAFSECFYKPQIEYAEKIIKHSKSGYMICNPCEFCNEQSFKEYFRSKDMNFRFTFETPQTGGSNFTITWGSEKEPLTSYTKAGQFE